jgi:hypothetical protein
VESRAGNGGRRKDNDAADGETEKEIVAPRFAPIPKWVLPPFHSVGRCDGGRHEIAQEVRQLMAKSPVDLSLAMSDRRVAERAGPHSARPAGKTNRPFNTNLRGQTGCALPKRGPRLQAPNRAGRLFNMEGRTSD